MSLPFLNAQPEFVETPAAPRSRGRAVQMMIAPAGFVKNTTQGACAGILTLAGITQISGSAVAASGDGALVGWSLVNFGEQLVAGNFTAILQLAGAAALFLAAGKGFARVFGLLALFAAAAAYYYGVGIDEIVERAQLVYKALGPAYDAFNSSVAMAS